MSRPIRTLLAAAALVPAALLALAAAPVCAEIRLEPPGAARRPVVPFSDGMVLQRDVPAPVWGWADPGENVSVSIGAQTKQAVTAGDGTWRVVLDPMPAGGPHQLTIEGTNTIVVSDVLVGEVWVCSGQSNMVVRRAKRRDLVDYPQIRALARSGRWNDRASGVAFAFAKELQAQYGVPVGILNRAAGGTPIRLWLAPEAAADSDPDVQGIVDSWTTFGEQYAQNIEPLEGYAIRGVVWWQGEQDLKLARQEIGSVLHYYHLLPALVRSWRVAWQRSDLPFVLMQLPTGGGMQIEDGPAPLPAAPPEPDNATLMRRATFHGLSAPDTTLTISVDIRGGVHPRDRELYAHRIANNARASAYGESFAYSGPIYSSMSVEGGNRVRLSFRPGTAEGLQAVGGPLQGFSISGDGETFVWASAEIDGNQVVVWNDDVPVPTVVRYAWAREPEWANLFNGDLLGAAPFSTEDPPAP